ncbi:MAG: GGDEF domain-containing protein [Pseudohongiellaceae bacterium]|nr:GGDEF domain-containing protein [Pseudohongiellaceae bacterium]
MIDIDPTMYTYALFIVMNAMVLGLIAVAYFIRNVRSSVLSPTLFQIYFILGELGWLVLARNAVSDSPVSSDNSELSFLLCSYILLLAVYKPLQRGLHGKLLAALHVALCAFFYSLNSQALESAVIAIYSILAYGFITWVCFHRAMQMHNIGHAILGVASSLVVLSSFINSYVLIVLQDLSLAGGITVIVLATTYTLVGIGFLSSVLINEHRELSLLSMSDPLTEIYNRRGLEKAVQRFKSARNKQNWSMSVISVDLDHFKDINDNYGHDKGDLVLKNVARLISKNRRKEDICARVGGEEFVIVLPDTNEQDAVDLAEQLRLRLHETFVKVGNETVKVSASFGVASQLNSVELDEVLKRSDQALYRAKQGGRNKVCV